MPQLRILVLNFAKDSELRSSVELDSLAIFNDAPAIGCGEQGEH